MALHILNQAPVSQGSFGTGLASGLASGIGQSLSALAQNKVGEMQMQKRAKAWESIGLDSNMANFIVQQPEWLQKELVGRMEGLGQPQTSSLPQAQDIGRQQAQQSSTGVRIGASKEDKKRAHEEQKVITKEVLPYIKDVQSKAKGAKENDMRLNRMEKLIETGKLNNPTYAGLLKTLKHGVFGLGIDLTNLLSPESQEFEKISGDFVKNAKDIFGSRITDTDLKSFLATIPNLSQTNEGKSAVIRNLKLMNKAAEIKAEAARKLLKHYNNRPPLDFESQVEDLVQPELSAIAAEFESGSKGTKVAKTTTLPGDIIGGLGQAVLGVS